MSILHLNQIKNHLETTYSGLVDISDCKGDAHQTEGVFLTRALSAYSIQYYSGVTPILAAKSIIDGGDDNGIDAILYSSDTKTLYISQSKWMRDGKGEPENGDVKKFLSGIKDLFNLSFDRFNSKLQAKETIIKNAIVDPNTSYQIILTYSGINDLAEHSSRDVADFLEEMNDASEQVYFAVMNQRPLHQSLISDVTGQPIDLTVTLKSWGKIDEPFKGFYGQVNGLEIFTWWQSHRDKLFKKNIRGVLGDTSVNQDITKTLNDSPDLFWYFNNGITMLSSSATKNMVGGSGTDYGQFSCQDISIVNGAQTVSTIGKFGELDPTNLENAFVSLRIISLNESSDTFGEQVTKSNNKQNRVENSDFVSFDPEQIRLRDELAIEGINYQISRSETNVNDDNSFDLIEAFTALSCASNDTSIVVQLKREIGKLWEDLSKAPYKKLFNASTSGTFVFNCVRVQRLIDSILIELQSNLNGRKEGVVIHGNRVLSMITFSEINIETLKDPNWTIDSLSKDSLKNSIEILYKTLYYIFDAEYEGAVIPTFFKNKGKCSTVVSMIPDFKSEVE